MARRYDPKVKRTPMALAVMVLLHAVVAYVLLAYGSRPPGPPAQRPLMASIVEEAKVPEPPPPPPAPPVRRQEVAAQTLPPFVPPPDVAPPAALASPVVESVAIAPPAQHVIAPPALVAPPATPARIEIGVACPHQVQPEMPSRAAREGISGVVRAQVRIREGVVREVTVLSGPGIFHSAVRDAVMQYRCKAVAGAEVIAVQDFRFEAQ